MGIFCEIRLCKPADSRYVFQPGGIVSGEIRYYLDQEYEFTSIIVSLKGAGKLSFEDEDDQSTYSNEEKYVDIDNITYKNEKNKSLPVGQYETPFSFQLPYNIPSSLDYKNVTSRYDVRCIIKYYVRIKFERPGRLYANKHYKKEINVISGQRPWMTTKPLIYGEQKKLLQLGTLIGEKSVVKLKAIMANSVLKPGKSVSVNYEIENNTSVNINRVKVKLLTVDRYTSKKGHEVKVRDEVEGTVFTYGAIKAGETEKFNAEIVVPSSCASISHSKMIGREYSVLTTVVLPQPHKKMRLEIPFQVIAMESSSFGECGASSSTAGYCSDGLPTYWEAMGEEKNKSFDTDVVQSGEEVKKKW